MAIGPKAQAILMRYLLRPDDAYCFSPTESEKQRRRENHEARVTPAGYGNRPGTNRKRSPKWKPGARYTTASYLRLGMECDSKQWLPADNFHSRLQELLRHIRKAVPPATSNGEPVTSCNDATLLAIKLDTKHDNGKKSKRILKTVHYDCIRLYKAEIQPDAPRPVMRQIVEDYVAGNPYCGSTVASIMRVLNDHPGKWKLKRPTPRRQPR